MKKNILLLAVICFSCNVKEEFKTITIEKKYSLSIPDNLEKATKLNDDASLQYQDLFNEYYVIAIDEPKESFSNAIIKSNSDITPNLEGYYNLITTSLPEKLKNCKLYDQKTNTINGKRVKIFSASGTIEDFDVFYRYAIVEGHADYYQIMLWTEKSKESKYKELMEKTILSFKEIGNNNAEKLFQK